MEQLASHRVVNYLLNASGRPLDWRFKVNGDEIAMTMPSRFAVNETDAYLQCGLEGRGLIQLSEFVVSPYLKTGRLKEVLASARSTPVPISILYPHARNAATAGPPLAHSIARYCTVMVSRIFGWMPQKTL